MSAAEQPPPGLQEKKKKKKKSKEPSSSSLGQPLTIDGNVTEMMNMYGVDTIPQSLMTDTVYKVSIHVDVHNSLYHSNGNGLPQPGQPPPVRSPIKREMIVFPNVSEGPVRIVCVGCRRWSLKGDVSVGVDIGNIPKTITMNNAQYAFTLSANSNSAFPECLFAVEPDPPIREMFPGLTEDDIGQGWGPVYRSGKGTNYVSCAVELDPKTGLPLCPVGYLMRMDYDRDGQGYELVQYGNSQCLEIPQSQFNTKVKEYRQQLADNKIMFNSANNDRLVFTASSTSPYYGSILLDIYYCKP